MKQFFKTLLASFIGALLALIISGLFMFAILGSLMTLSDTSDPSVPSSAILKLDFEHGVGEQSIEEPFDLSSINKMFGNSSKVIGILPLVNAIDYAATDPAIKFIYINADNANISISKAEEIRDALLRFRQSGKPIIAFSENYTQIGYYLASVADKIYTHPVATSNIIGLSANLMFFKDILNKIGVDVQLIRHGKYKSAGEQFINSDISEANREQNQSMVNSLWKTITESVCSSRGITPEDFNNRVDNLSLTTPEGLLEAKLIDGIIEKDMMSKELCNLFGTEKEEDLKMITVNKYAKARIKPNYKAKEKIAIIYADGEITLGKGEGISSDKYSEIISKVRKDSSIKAVVLRVNSPGGNAQAAEIIRNELMLLQKVKPVIASYGNYAASGGYWISANADKIFTDNTTLTGSIGVFSMIPSFGKVIKEKLYVNNVPINSNKHSDMFSLYRKLDPTEVASMQNSVETIYNMFLNIVAQGRDLTTEQVDSIAQGRVWTGSEALTINLANEKGGLIDALKYTALSVNLDNYMIVEYPVVKTTIDKLMENVGQASSSIEMVSDPEKLIEKAYSSMKENKGVFARMPYIYQFE